MVSQRAPSFDRLIRLPDTDTVLSPNPWGGKGSVSTVPGPRVWAERRDFLSKDTLEQDRTLNVDIDDTRYVIRAEGVVIRPGEKITDEDGNTAEVRGVSQIGRRYLELLTRRVG